MKPPSRSAVIAPLVSVCACVGGAREGGREPIASKTDLFWEDLDTQVAAADPLSISTPWYPLGRNWFPYAGAETIGRIEPGIGNPGAAAERSRFDHEMAGRLWEIDERLA